MDYLHAIHSTDENGNPVIPENEKKLYAIADTILQIMKENELCIGEGRAVLEHCKSKLKEKALQFRIR